MKNIEVKIIFNISEKKYNSEEFQEFKNDILRGEFKRELLKDNKFKLYDLKTTIKTK